MNGHEYYIYDPFVAIHVFNRQRIKNTNFHE